MALIVRHGKGPMVGVELFRRQVRQCRMRAHLIVIVAPASQHGASFTKR